MHDQSIGLGNTSGQKLVAEEDGRQKILYSSLQTTRQQDLDITAYWSTHINSVESTVSIHRKVARQILMDASLCRDKCRGYTREAFTDGCSLTTAPITLQLVCQQACVVRCHGLIGLQGTVKDFENFGKVFHCDFQKMIQFNSYLIRLKPITIRFIIRKMMIFPILIRIPH